MSKLHLVRVTHDCIGFQNGLLSIVGTDSKHYDKNEVPEITFLLTDSLGAVSAREVEKAICEEFGGKCLVGRNLEWNKDDVILFTQNFSGEIDDPKKLLEETRKRLFKAWSVASDKLPHLEGP